MSGLFSLLCCWAYVCDGYVDVELHTANVRTTNSSVSRAPGPFAKGSGESLAKVRQFCHCLHTLAMVAVYAATIVREGRKR